MNDYETVLQNGVFTLSKPYKYANGEEYTVLNFPLQEMTGQHIRSAQRNYEVVEGNLTGMAELSKIYQAYLAAALMKVPPDFVFELPVRDFTELTLFIQRFLLNAA